MPTAGAADPLCPPSETAEPEPEVEILVVAAEPRIEDLEARHGPLPQSLHPIQPGGAGNGEHRAFSGVIFDRAAAVDLNRQAGTIEKDAPSVDGRAGGIRNGPLDRRELGFSIEGVRENAEPARFGCGIVVQDGHGIEFTGKRSKAGVDRRRKPQAAVKSLDTEIPGYRWRVGSSREHEGRLVGPRVEGGDRLDTVLEVRRADRWDDEACTHLLQYREEIGAGLGMARSVLSTGSPVALRPFAADGAALAINVTMTAWRCDWPWTRGS